MAHQLHDDLFTHTSVKEEGCGGVACVVEANLWDNCTGEDSVPGVVVGGWVDGGSVECGAVGVFAGQFFEVRCPQQPERVRLEGGSLYTSFDDCFERFDEGKQACPRRRLGARQPQATSEVPGLVIGWVGDCPGGAF